MHQEIKLLLKLYVTGFIPIIVIKLLMRRPAPTVYNGIYKI